MSQRYSYIIEVKTESGSVIHHYAAGFAEAERVLTTMRAMAHRTTGVRQIAMHVHRKDSGEHIRTATYLAAAESAGQGGGE